MTSGDTTQSSHAHTAFLGPETLLTGSGDLADLALLLKLCLWCVDHYPGDSGRVRFSI